MTRGQCLYPSAQGGKARKGKRERRHDGADDERPALVTQDANVPAGTPPVASKKKKRGKDSKQLAELERSLEAEQARGRKLKRQLDAVQSKLAESQGSGFVRCGRRTIGASEPCSKPSRRCTSRLQHEHAGAERRRRRPRAPRPRHRGANQEASKVAKPSVARKVRDGTSASKALRAAEDAFQERLAKHEEALDGAQEKVMSLQTQMYELVNDVSVAKKREEELKRRIETLESQNGQLESELSVERQALRSMRSVVDSDRGGGGVISAPDASAEAEMRKLSNEVQFMRQQLANEVQCKGELTDTVSSLNDQLKRTRRAAEKAFAEQAEAHKQEMRAAEERHRDELELPRSEVQHLEDKIQNLQVSLTNMAKDVAMARRKERAAQQEAQRLGEKGASLDDEKRSLERKIEALQSELEISEKGASVAGAERATTEARIRHLENEIEYLKSQLLLEKSERER